MDSQWILPSFTGLVVAKGTSSASINGSSIGSGPLGFTMFRKFLMFPWLYLFWAFLDSFDFFIEFPVFLAFINYFLAEQSFLSDFERVLVFYWDSFKLPLFWQFSAFETSSKTYWLILFWGFSSLEFSKLIASPDFNPESWDSASHWLDLVNVFESAISMHCFDFSTSARGVFVVSFIMLKFMRKLFS